jgi:electron transfer flavoprotein beta subunit
MMLPAVLDPWASHALYEAANLAKKTPGSKVWLVSLGPKAKLQQVTHRGPESFAFELVALDGPSSGFTDSKSPRRWPKPSRGLLANRSRLLVFGDGSRPREGGPRADGRERLGILDQCVDS